MHFRDFSSWIRQPFCFLFHTHCLMHRFTIQISHNLILPNGNVSKCINITVTSLHIICSYCGKCVTVCSRFWWKLHHDWARQAFQYNNHRLASAKKYITLTKQLTYQRVCIKSWSYTTLVNMVQIWHSTKHSQPRC